MKTVKRYGILFAALLLLLLSGCGSGGRDHDDDDDSERAEYYKEARYYNEDNELSYANEYEDGRLKSYIYYDEDGEAVYYEDYRETDACANVDTSEIEDMDGVREVLTLEVYYREADDDDYMSGDDDGNYRVFIVFGYNRDDRLVATQVVRQFGDRYLADRTTVYTLDDHGNPVSAIRTAGNGEKMAEFEFDNEYRSGRLVKAEQKTTIFSEVIWDPDGELEVRAFDEPRQSVTTIEYVY